MKRHLTKKEKGFTLIELMIVIAILGILAAVAIPNFLNARGKAQDASASTTLDAVKTALEMYAADYGTYPLSMSSAAGLSTALSTDFPNNVTCGDSTFGQLASAETDAGGTTFEIVARGRDGSHYYGLNQAGKKVGPLGSVATVHSNLP